MEMKETLYGIAAYFDRPLRHNGKYELLNAMYDFLVDLKVYASRCQRCGHQLPNLRGEPVWAVEETGYQEKLRELEANWRTIRDEGLQLIKSIPKENITFGETTLVGDREQWKQYMLNGFNRQSFPEYMCKYTPVTCSLLKDYAPAVDVPMDSTDNHFLSICVNILQLHAPY